MTADLRVADINSYLAATGWTRRPERWRGAAIWVHEGDHEILVPGTDGLADGPRRVREIVALLAKVEGRPREAIATDIASPLADVQWYRAPIGPKGGRLGLVDAVTAFGGAQAVLAAAARAALSGPRAVFDGVAPKPVRELLSRVWIGPIVPSGDLLAVRVPLERAEDGEPPLARRALVLLRRATALLGEACERARRTGDVSVFDDTVRDGVSADLCAALASFAGSGGSFEVGFRWARGMPAAEPEGSVVFAAEAGPLLRRVAHRLRRVHQQRASATGIVGALFDNGGGDRFRVHVRGEVTIDDGETRGSIWIRLPDEAAYDLAVDAHRRRIPVRADGVLKEVHGRLELLATGFAAEPHDRPEEI